ncbi:hypothetical protein A2V49_04820 [candidate division WWE3 bacterium RBG_19FT_COMBO_34_6]|uniref:Uncharacterized protein n=1 Tax=candidate division WWE3 bacterium RBG_19FT_COMBO_34_6 TaxID=1802612 RepID=A0A1F4UL40_UNCKA|nr:MAG: hypothetical protein A2V49_04820 [candidate division WWE3 bacterium RBG_19FT_COMBO_34_6]
MIRFTVGNKEKILSPIWRFWIQKNDVYFLTRTMGNTWKISMHASGLCRIAWNKGVSTNQTDRLILRWNKGNYTVEKFLPSIGLSVPNLRYPDKLNSNKEHHKDTVYIPTPKVYEEVKIRVFFAKDNQGKNNLLNKLPRNIDLLFEDRLSNKDYVLVYTWVEPISIREKNLLKEEVLKFNINVVSEEAKKNIDSVFALWINKPTIETQNQPTITIYPLRYINLHIEK